MVDTYSQIYIHLVFAVEHRQQLISDEWREDLHRLMTKIIRNQDQLLVRINSMPDHVHLLVALEPNRALSELVREVKSGSARFINESDRVRGTFRWQEGFGAFSISKSQVEQVIQYIDRQQEHHQKTSFQEEYIQFLDSYDVDYEERYLFDFQE